jgi:signal transduction histidine kinase
MATPHAMRLPDGRILIVDDQVSNIRVLEGLLRRMGFANVRSLTNGHNILEFCGAWRPDLILLDLHMPEVDGFEALRQLREGLPRDEYLPVLVLTADITMVAKQRALELGANDFLTKPFDMVEARLRIRNLIETRLLHRQIRGQNELLEAQARERDALLEAEQEHARRLAELAVLKADFTAMVVHEFGNPLAAIRGLADMLATGRLAPDQQAGAIAMLQSEVKLLTILLADMRVAASIERDDFTIQPRDVPLGMLAADATMFAQSLPGAHPFTTNLPEDVVVHADPYRIGQVLRNLLGNAAKYTPEGTPIELRATLSADRVQIAVVDYGPGIAPDDLERIFEKFGRGRDQGGRKVPGVGLGLYLSRRIIQAHGTELEVESTVGRGSVFAFELERVA